MRIPDYFRKKLNKNTDAKEAKEYTLDESLHQAYNREITRNEFVIRLRTYQVSPGWLEMQLLLAYDQLDEWKISVLLLCLGSKSIKQCSNQELAPILSFLCEIMENPRWGGLTEEIADAIGYFHLDKKALRSLVNGGAFWRQKTIRLLVKRLGQIAPRRPPESIGQVFLRYDGYGHLEMRRLRGMIIAVKII